MRGYFGIGVEGISKAMNVGSIFRTGHAFNASFVFTVSASYNKEKIKCSDTSHTVNQLPFYNFPNDASMIFPENCALIGVELTDDAIQLPKFRHPRCAAYIFGPERGTLSRSMQKKCEQIVMIPTKFCINVGLAAAIILYDRLLSTTHFGARPVVTGGKEECMPTHKHGNPIRRSPLMERYRDNPPLEALKIFDQNAT